MKGKAAGSFGIPEDLLKEVNKSKEKAQKSEGKKPSSTYDSESIPEDDGYSFDDGEKKEDPRLEKDKVNPVDETEPEPTLEEQIATIEKYLGITITEDDLWSIFMGETLEKSGIVIIPGKLEATFRTLSLDDTQTVDQHMAEAVEKKYLEAGFHNLKTKHLLSRGLVALGKPGKAKSLGHTKDTFDALGGMSAILIEKLAQRWNQFTWLVNVVVNKEMDSGKS